MHIWNEYPSDVIFLASHLRFFYCFLPRRLYGVWCLVLLLFWHTQLCTVLNSFNINFHFFSCGKQKCEVEYPSGGPEVCPKFDITLFVFNPWAYLSTGYFFGAWYECRWRWLQYHLIIPAVHIWSTLCSVNRCVARQHWIQKIIVS